MEEAAFVEWFKNDGECVKAGDPLFAVETDKTVQEIESLDAGILRILPMGLKEGDMIKVGDVLGYIVAAGEAMPSGKVVPAPEKKVAAIPDRAEESLRPKADAAAVSTPAADRSGRPVSPRAARRSIQEGVDLRYVQGTGRGGRIRESDVLAARKGKPGLAAVASAPAMPTISGREVPVTTLRQTIAERMHCSKTLTAPVTLTTRVDADALVCLREGLKVKGGAVPSYGDIIMRQVALTLVDHPALNARWEDDHLRFPDAVNIGFAVDTEAGLVVPVVRDAPQRSLMELAGMTRDLTERARLRRLSTEEMSGGTFTVTNLGMAGIDAFTPIINWPECAVLGVGRIMREPVVKGAKVVVGNRLWLSLTFDHRIVDGTPAARFLEAVKGRIEKVIAHD